MLGDIDAEQLLLPRQHLGLRYLGGHQLQRREGRGDAVAEHVEHRRLPGLLELRLALRERHDAVEVGDERAAAGQHVESPALDQRFERAPVQRLQVDALREVFDAVERRARFASGDNAVRRALSDILDRREAVDDRGVAVDIVQLEVGAAAVDVGRQHADAEAHAFGHGLGDALVRAGAGQHGGHVLVRVVRFQVRRLVGDRAVAGGMRLVERIARERFDEVEDGARLLLAVAVLHGGGNELLALGLHEAGVLLGHGLADRVGVLQVVAGELLEDEQHLVLVGDDAVRLVEDLREVRMRVLDERAIVLRAAVGADVLHRTGPIQRDERHQLGDAVRPQLLDRAAHARRLQLEDAERIALTEHLERPRVAIRQRRQVDRHAVSAGDDLDGAAEDREIREAEEVHLEQANLCDLRHGELRRRDRRLVAARRALERHVLRERLAGNDDAGRVRAGVPRNALEPARRIDQAADLRLGLVRARQLGALVECLAERHVQCVGNEAGDSIDLAVAHAERAARVADRRLRAERPERDDLRDAVVPVLLRDVSNHLVTPVIGDVHVDVGRLLAVDVQEALEDEARGERVDEGDVERVQDDARRCRAAHAEHDAGALAELGDVVDDEKVIRETRLLDDVKLVLQAGAHVVRCERVLAIEPLAREACQVLVGGDAGRDLRLRQKQPPELQLEVALLGDELRVRHRLRKVAEQLEHLRFRLHVVGVVVHLQLPLRVIDRRVRADAQQHVVDRRVLARRVVRVVRRDERDGCFT